MLSALSVGPLGERVQKVSEGSQRRAKQLSVIFSQYITSMMNSGEVCPELVDLNFEIQQVKITTDFSVINVYWMASGTDTDDRIQALLDASAGKLRGALIGLHIIGAVPPIQFVKDMTAARLQEVEQLLQKADMGPDHEPTPLGGSMRTNPRLDYHQLSVQSRLAGVTEHFEHRMLGDFGETRQGPSGSVEVVGMGYRQTVEQPDGGVTSDVHHNDFGQASTDFHEYIQRSNVSGYDVGSQSVSGEQFMRKGDVPDESINIALRDNLYDVPHTKLTLQVLNAKRKSRDRTYDMSGDTNNLDKLFSNSDLEKLLSLKRRQQKGVVRLKEQLTHGNIDVEGNYSRDASKYEDIYEIDDEEDFIDDDDFDSYSGRK